MAFLEELGKTLTKVGEATVQKTKEVADYTKANAKILEIQNKLDKAYIEVGKKYLELHPVNDEEDMAEVVGVVYEMEDLLKELRKQLQELKGTVKCEACGLECDSDDVFCRKCGAELKKEEVITDAEEVAEEVTEEDFEEVVEAVEETAEEVVE